MLTELMNISFIRCDSISSLNGYNSVNPIFQVEFEDCRIRNLPQGIENLKPMLRLSLIFPNDYKDFSLEQELSCFTKRNNIIGLFIKYKLLDKFPSIIFKLTSLQTLIFYNKNISYYPLEFDKLYNLMHLWITTYDDKVFRSAMKNSNFNMYCSIKYDDNLQFEKDYEISNIYRDKLDDVYPMSLILLQRDTSKVIFHKMGNAIIKFHLFPKEESFKIEIQNIVNNDSVIIILNDLTEKEIKQFNYKIPFNEDIKANENLIDLSIYDSEVFYLKIVIDGKSKTWRIYNRL